MSSGLIPINYPGSNNYSTFAYDGLGNRVEIIETAGGAVTGTKQLVFCGSEICEERDATGTLTKQFFNRGQTTGGTSNKYFYSMNHRSDVCSVSDSTGNDVTKISYDPWGRPLALLNTLNPDFTFAGMYIHARSGLNLTAYRAYSSLMARWLSRDPVQEAAGLNLFAYVLNQPISAIDPLGTDIYVKYGNNVKGGGGGSWHTQVCVDTWESDCCDKPGNQKNGRRCFSYGLFAGDNKGHYYEEPKENQNNPIFEGKTTKTNCEQDKEILEKLIALTGPKGPVGEYDFVWNSHNVPSLLWQALSPK